jgi:hypothetical protein
MECFFKILQLANMNAGVNKKAALIKISAAINIP